jgi:hypothetical protein
MCRWSAPVNGGLRNKGLNKGGKGKIGHREEGSPEARRERSSRIFTGPKRWMTDVATEAL